MSEADKMLEESDYYKSYEDKECIEYRLKSDSWISYFELDLEYKQINLEMLDCADFKLIKGIYMKCEELGWNK